MTKTRLLGTAIILCSVLAGPALAKHRHTASKHLASRHLASKPVPAVACDPRDPGNPFSEKYDFETWSAWRRRGSWDARADWTCQPIPSYYR